MVRIVEGKISEVWGKVSGLLREHWDELTLNKRVMPLEPDQARYQALEESGNIFALFAYDGDQIVGYSSVILSPHLQSRNAIIAMSDALFVTKHRRHGRIGIRLILASALRAKELGAALMLWYAKPNTQLSKILPRLGYSIQETVFTRELI